MWVKTVFKKLFQTYTEAIATHHNNLIKNLNFFRKITTKACFYLADNIVEI